MHEKEKVFLSVLEKYKGIIYKVANTYCHDKFDREDLIQEIIMQVWLTVDSFNDDYKWSTWIYRVALNTSISFYRKNKTRKERTVHLPAIIEIPSTSEQSFEDDEFLLLKSFIHKLKEIDRAVIMLHLEGLKVKEISNILDTSQTNITTKIYRIRKKLKAQFKAHKSKTHG